MAYIKQLEGVAFLEAVLESVLIVSSEKGQRSLAQLLKAGGDSLRITAAACGGEARRVLLARDFDLVVINAPLIDESGQELASLVAQRQAGSVLLLIKGDAPHCAEDGVVSLQKPLNKAGFEQAVALVRVMNRRLAALAADNRRLLRRLEELRVVSRAKCLLIANCAMTEAEAHSFIEKTAMDSRETKLAVAAAVINKYK